MRLAVFVLFFLSAFVYAIGQWSSSIDWYSETVSEGTIIQNSFPKGGSYKEPIQGKYNISYLIFFSRVVNLSAQPIELSIHFPSDSFAIPDSPITFLKLFLPEEEMALDKVPLYNYGLSGVAPFVNIREPAQLKKTIYPNEDFLFYVGTLFYQTHNTTTYQARGGNRAELVLKGQDLYYRMLPQLELFPCGRISLKQ